MRETTVTQTWTCDLCGDVATTPRGIPDGWSVVEINTGFPDVEMQKHVCGKQEPSCFRRLLIQLANEDKKRP